jgi:hypothetical protein
MHSHGRVDFGSQGEARAPTYSLELRVETRMESQQTRTQVTRRESPVHLAMPSLLCSMSFGAGFTWETTPQDTLERISTRSRGDVAP